MSKSKLTTVFLSIVTTFLMIVSLISLNSGTVNVQAQSRSTETVTREVPVNRTASIPIYFRYGSAGSDINISDAAASITISNPQNSSSDPVVEFVREGNQDIFNGDPARGANDPIPDAPGNCSNFNAPRYDLPAALFTSYRMNNYGLQTAKDTAQQTAILTRGSTGCLFVQVRLRDTARVGDEVNIQFDWDAAQSPDLRADQRPSLVVVNLRVVEAPVSSAPASSAPVSSSAPASSAPISSSSISSVVRPVQTTTRSGGIALFVGLALAGLASTGVILFRMRRTPKYDL